MKMIIDIPENVVTAIQNGEDYRYDIHTTIAQGIPYEEKGDLISREDLIDVILNDRKLDGENANWEVNRILVHIKNAPTVESDEITNADLFKQTFGIYATELWSMKEAEFLDWLNTERGKE